MMDRFPFVITLGGALLGWIAGEMLVSDTVLQPVFQGISTWLHYASATVGSFLVVAIGKFIATRATDAKHQLIDLAMQQPEKETSAAD